MTGKGVGIVLISQQDLFLREMDPVCGVQSVGIVPAALVDVVEVTVMQDVPCIKQVQDPIVAETAAGVAAVFVDFAVRAHERARVREVFPVPGHIMSPALVQPQVLCRCVLMENMVQAIVLTEPVGSEIQPMSAMRCQVCRY